MQRFRAIAVIAAAAALNACASVQPGKTRSRTIKSVSVRATPFRVPAGLDKIYVTLKPLFPDDRNTTVRAIVYVIDSDTNEIFAKKEGKIGYVKKGERAEQSITLPFDASRFVGQNVRAEAYYRTPKKDQGAVLRVIPGSGGLQGRTMPSATFIPVQQDPDPPLTPMCIEICPHSSPHPNGVRPHCAGTPGSARPNACRDTF